MYDSALHICSKKHKERPFRKSILTVDLEAITRGRPVQTECAENGITDCGGGFVGINESVCVSAIRADCLVDTLWTMSISARGGRRHWALGD